VSETGDGGSILVIGEIQADTDYDKAYVSVGADVEIIDLDGKRFAFEDLSPLTEVEVWFTGPVAESYPVQAAAKHIEVLGYDAP
jgi:beta-N-acetylhexosaminidase